MKELSIEEKAKRYDEAVERAQSLKNKWIDEDGEDVAFMIFPELAESEDERIRKWIIDDIRYSMNNEPLNNSEYKKKAEKAIAWLEKQGEQKVPTLEQAANIFLDALSNSPYNNKPITDAQTITKQLLNFLQNSASYNPDALVANEQKPTWSEEDENRFKNLIMLVNCSDENEPTKKGFINFINRLKSLKERVGCEVNCTTTKEWSEEDENEYNHILKTLTSVEKEQETKGYNNLISSINWLKSLKERVQLQPKQEWSEEDETYSDHIITAIKSYYSDDKGKENPWREELLRWLKSLKPQNRWKPSDELIETLDSVIRNPYLSTIEFYGLIKLMKQLEKLKE